MGAKDGGARTNNQGVVRAIQCWIGEPIAGVHFKAARVVKLNHGGLDCGLHIHAMQITYYGFIYNIWHVYIYIYMYIDM